MSKLALLGGQPVRTKPFPAYNCIGPEEKRAVMDVLDSGVLSRFLGAWDPDFYGGPRVLAFEQAWSEFVGMKHAVSVNSATSGLFCAVGAAGIEPGDEVIVSPYTMCASATCALIYNGIPVFADIEPRTFGLDPQSIRERITPRTRAIVVVHIFGHPADMDPIMEIAAEHNLTVIEDCAQSPAAKYKGRLVGTIGHMGVFSLNYHKHIHTGEGGVITTNDDDLAERLQLIRNHGEAVVGPKGVKNISNLIGFNFRMTEIEAAIGIEQLKKLPNLLASRIDNANYLAEQIGKLPGLEPAEVRPECTHVYYVQPCKFDEQEIGVTRDRFIEAVRAELPPTKLREAEGPLLSSGYVSPVYLQPLYQEQICYGTKGFPFKGPHYDGKVDYRLGLCPTTERMHFRELFIHEFMRPPSTQADHDDVIRAFGKVYENRNELAN